MSCFTCPIMSHMLDHVMSHMCVMSHVSCPTMSHMSCLTCHVPPCLMACHVSHVCHVMSHHVSCHVVSHVMFQHVPHFISCLTHYHVSHVRSWLTWHVLPYLMSCLNDRYMLIEPIDSKGSSFLLQIYCHYVSVASRSIIRYPAKWIPRHESISWVAIWVFPPFWVLWPEIDMFFGLHFCYGWFLSCQTM